MYYKQAGSSSSIRSKANATSLFWWLRSSSTAQPPPPTTPTTQSKIRLLLLLLLLLYYLNSLMYSLLFKAILIRLFFFFCCSFVFDRVSLGYRCFGLFFLFCLFTCQLPSKKSRFNNLSSLTSRVQTDGQRVSYSLPRPSLPKCPPLPS